MSATTVSFNRKAYFSLAGIGVLQLASYSGYSGLLVLYIIEPEVGFQMSDAEAAQYYSYFRYIGIGTLLLAGILADLVIPRKLRMPIGLALSILGYFIVLVPDKNALLVSMTLIGLGYGLTFTSINSMIGDLYVKDNEIFTPTSMSIITQTGTGRFRQTQIAILLVFIQLSNLTRFLISYNYTEAQSLNPMDSRILFTGIASVLLLAITLVMLRILKPDKPPSVK